MAKEQKHDEWTEQVNKKKTLKSVITDQGIKNLGT